MPSVTLILANAFLLLTSFGNIVDAFMPGGKPAHTNMNANYHICSFSSSSSSSSSCISPRTSTVAFYKNLQEYEVDGNAIDLDTSRKSTPLPARQDSVIATARKIAMTTTMTEKKHSKSSIAPYKAYRYEHEAGPFDMTDTSLLLNLPKSVFQKVKMNQNTKRLTILLSLEMIVGRTAIIGGSYMLLQEILTGASMTDQLHGMVDTVSLYL